MQTVAIRNFLFLFCTISCCGCATMVRSSEDVLRITSQPSGAKATLSTGQECITPCSLALSRKEDVKIVYDKSGCKKQSLLVISKLDNGVSLVSGIIDYASGATYSLKPNPAHATLVCNDGEMQTS